MTAKKPANTPTTVVADDPDDRKGRLKNIGGSQSDHWNNIARQSGRASALDEELKRRGTRQAIERHRRGADRHRARRTNSKA